MYARRCCSGLDLRIASFQRTVEEHRLSGRGCFVGYESIPLHEQGDGAHVHLETVPGHDSTERLLVERAVMGGGSKVAISAKYLSKPAGETISSARAGRSPAFQKACGT